MRQLISFLIFFSLFACGENYVSESEIDFSSIQEELEGKTLGKKVTYSAKNVTVQKLDATIYLSQKEEVVNELDIHFHSIDPTTFSALQNFYNQQFNTTESDSLYCTWQTDSTEFILYKNSDSSILVNIYKR